MRVSGTDIANDILQDLTSRIQMLQNSGIIPELAVILVGDDPASLAYISQKKRAAEKIGARVDILTYPTTVKTSVILQKIHELNENPDVHGIIVQRPLSDSIDEVEIDFAIDPKKDVDGFHESSYFKPPVALAVLRLLQHISDTEAVAKKDFFEWMRTKHIVVIGKGKAGGRPILDYLHELGLSPEVITSTTAHKEETINKADIIISAVGKRHIVSSKDVKKGAILISIGLHKGSDRALHGDYEEDEIAEKAAYFTPSPGGVGPVNVAMLLSNLVLAAEHN